MGATINNQNYFFGSPRARLSFRKYKSHENKNPKTIKVISSRISNQNFGFNDDLGSEEYTDPIILADGSYINHTAAGDYDTPLKKGGYILIAEEGELFDPTYLGSIFDSALLDESWGFIIVEFAFYNRNYGFVCQNDIIFVKSAAGITTQDYHSSVIEDYYVTSLDYFRA